MADNPNFPVATAAINWFDSKELGCISACIPPTATT